MLTMIAVLTFAGALGAVGLVLYATVVPSLPKIRAALSGAEAGATLPSLPPRRASTLRVTMRPVAQPQYWRAAA